MSNMDTFKSIITECLFMTNEKYIYMLGVENLMNITISENNILKLEICNINRRKAVYKFNSVHCENLICFVNLCIIFDENFNKIILNSFCLKISTNLIRKTFQ